MPDSSTNPAPNDDTPPPRGTPQTRAAAIDVTTHAPAIDPPETGNRHAAALAALREAALRAAGVLPHPALPAGEQPRFWLKRGDQLFVAVLVTLATGLMFAHWIRVSDWGRQPVEIDRLPRQAYLYRIDINRATWVEWAQFDGIGETLARRIVEDRDRNGAFTNIDDLLRVRGIGRVKLDAMRRHLEFDESRSLPVPAGQDNL
jgi:competence protein ComEA